MRKSKNILCIAVCLTLALTLSGCGEKKLEERTLTCTLYQKNVINNYELNSTYKIYATGEVVNKVETTEVVNSDDETVIDYFEETLDTSYTSMNNAYGGYDYNITRENGTLTATTTIDYNEMDLEQLATDDASMKAIINEDKKITIEGIKSLYEQMGAECE